MDEVNMDGISNNTWEIILPKVIDAIGIKGARSLEKALEAAKKGDEIALSGYLGEATAYRDIRTLLTIILEHKQNR